MSTVKRCGPWPKVKHAQIPYLGNTILPIAWIWILLHTLTLFITQGYVMTLNRILSLRSRSHFKGGKICIQAISLTAILDLHNAWNHCSYTNDVSWPWPKVIFTRSKSMQLTNTSLPWPKTCPCHRGLNSHLYRHLTGFFHTNYKTCCIGKAAFIGNTVCYYA